MRVLHVIPSLSLKHGGPSVALPLMARALASQGIAVDVATTNDDGPGGRLSVPLGERVERDGYGVFYFAKQSELYKVSLPLGQWLRRRVEDYDVVHVHALFSHASVAAGRCARRAGVPYVVRPLGVLNRWGMENRRRWLKRLSFRFVERPLLRRAAAMHFTSEAERAEAEATGATGRAAVIPLGIDVRTFEYLPSAEKFFEQWPQARGRRIILFCSRIDRKKGLDLLIEALAKCKGMAGASGDFTSWLLVVAGSGDKIFEQELRMLAGQLGVAGNILWAGFLEGDRKLSVLAAANVFVLPSHSENFGIALVEALAAGLPCITTRGVAVSAEIAAAQAGMVVGPEPGQLATALSQLMADEELCVQLGARAKMLAAEKFSLESMGSLLKNLYESLLAGRR